MTLEKMQEDMRVFTRMLEEAFKVINQDNQYASWTFIVDKNSGKFSFVSNFPLTQPAKEMIMSMTSEKMLLNPKTLVKEKLEKGKVTVLEKNGEKLN